MSILSKHPQKIEIDRLIKSNAYSYRQLQTEFLTRFGVSISFKSIQQYHTKELGGAVDIPSDNDNDNDNGGTGLVPLDNDKVTDLINELKDGWGNSGQTVKNELFELFAIQTQITKNALLQHVNGNARYPSEYVKNLQIFANLILR